MSHFFLTVLLPNGTPREDIESAVVRAVAPFQENNNDDCPPELLTFHSVVADYETVQPADHWYAEVRGKRFADLFPTVKEYAAWHGQDELDEKAGQYGYWENPNAKWDWFSIGGRYAGRMGTYDPSKDEKNYKTCFICNGTGTRLGTVYPPGEAGDWARKGDDLHPVIGSGCNCCRGTGKELKPASAWEQVSNAAPVSELAADFSCFAFLTPEGEWIERGSMGWFGCVSGEKDDGVWKEQIRAVLARHRDCVAVAVDCHI